MSVLRLTMAQALLKFLDQQYVERDGQERKFVRGVMGIFGHGNVLGLGEALEQEVRDLQFIQGKNEQGMAHAAIAYAKQKNRLEIFACTSSIGPGALNMVTAAATATVNRIPVLLLPGDIFACRQPDPVLQQIEHPMDYTISANDAFKPVSKYWDRITRPEQLMSAMMQAMRVLTDPAETGAVTICLPQDVQTEAYDYPEHFFAKRVHVVDRTPPSRTACDKAVQVIARKKKPMIIAGGGVHYAEAYQPLLQFAESFGIPIAETQAGKSAVPWHHPLYLGGIGTTGSLAANRYAKEADVIICVGTRLGDFATASKSAFQHPDVEWVHLNINNFDADKIHGVKVVADAAEALTALTVSLTSIGYEAACDMTALSDLKEEWEREVDRLYAQELTQGLSQTRVLGEINRFMDGSEVIVAAAGSLPGDLHRLWRAERPKSYHMEYGFSCMGYEVAGAFGAKLAAPDQEVYAIIGDGSYLMLHSELVTSLQEGVKITVILLDNHGFQCIHNLQKEHGSDGFGNEFRYRNNETGRLTGDYVAIDYAAHARSMGVAAYSAENIDQLREALQQAKQEKRSTLIAVQVVPGTNSGGYESWWRVDVPEVSSSEKVQHAHQLMRERTDRALKI
ncbi:3D-(3,5/4)-trihydroxycyclohexane-1,2-dione acylhydrolase (decyclizing) [Paenibacillus guangzhouensis]|uniref:3D-(3,5/4)-trihydroxycyclohexane-1,2-dione acylhydrolase (decyclizing) n=1 Tax=Paenibacillus guangzhouensis TaxID=1473112 RepID=UPI001266D530|nr:3D-(3,5/4)-trihydroxycyclohexane-1,2-dione acylhydrolase (decyclizing) [Paenibacillus guangzhouensis]